MSLSFTSFVYNPNKLHLWKNIKQYQSFRQNTTRLHYKHMSYTYKTPPCIQWDICASVIRDWELQISKSTNSAVFSKTNVVPSPVTTLRSRQGTHCAKDMDIVIFILHLTNTNFTIKELKNQTKRRGQEQLTTESLIQRERWTLQWNDTHMQSVHYCKRVYKLKG